MKNAACIPSLFSSHLFVEVLDMQDLSAYRFSCQVDHVLVVGEEDHLCRCRQISQNFEGCPGAGIVKDYEGIVYKCGRGLVTIRLFPSLKTAI